MKLYSFPSAPNPRRVLIFAAEKQLQIEVVNIDLRGGETKRPEFLQKNPSGKIPVLELVDGTCIAETVAICRYLESLAPEPNLFGRDALEIALIEAHHRHIEFELHTNIGAAWVNGPIVAAAGLVEPIEAQRLRGAGLTRKYYQRMDKELAERSFVAGERFTVADISALCMIDFAAAMVDLQPDSSLEHLWAWHERVSQRANVNN
ncbi:MAG: glutathione S-transferase [Gammaproteobacteria bacterium]|nr:glutathione S-transferase [Gammaproteobacteria bacterium]